MRVDHDRDLVSGNTGAHLQRFGQRTNTIDAVHRRLLRGPLVADSGFDQDLFRAGVDEHTIHVHPNPVVIVGRTFPRPELAWDYAEHRSSIETKLGVLDDLNAIVA